MANIDTYPIVETFHSLQGEGFWAGTSAVFMRLGGCDVYCDFCDTKESWVAKHHPQRSTTEIAQLIAQTPVAIAVITGGEPLMHNLTPLTEAIKSFVPHIPLHLETSGAHPRSGDFDWITLSPKTFKPPHPSAYEQVQELKVVVTGASDLEWAELQSSHVDSRALRYLQPEWGNGVAQELVLDYILAHPRWHLSLQSHKFLGVR